MQLNRKAMRSILFFNNTAAIAHRVTIRPRLRLTVLMVAAALAGFAADAVAGMAAGHPSTNSAAVVLVHGLGRTHRSMVLVDIALRQKGYAVYRVQYPSLKWTIDAAADRALAPVVARARSDGHPTIHFVTHSLGGIVVRRYLQDHNLPAGSRVVMLAPPNRGSELIDWARDRVGRFEALAGPAATELRTAEDALWARLKPVGPSVGVIAGRLSWNPLFSAMIPGEDDGKVAVQRTRLPEMQDFLLMDANHNTLLIDARVRRQIVCFLQNGEFCGDRTTIAGGS